MVILTKMTFLPIAIGCLFNYRTIFSAELIGCGWFSTIPNEYVNNDDFYVKKICLDDAWDVAQNAHEVKVGLIDTGINVSNNSLELSANINYTLSKDFIDENGNSRNLFSPCIRHGTYMASIIGAKGNNNNGKMGVCWNVDLVSLRIDELTSPYYENFNGLIDAIEYADEQNIPILNFSGGFLNFSGNEPLINSDQVQELISTINDYDGLIICSAGNYGLNFDSVANEVYPACLSNDNIITVGSCTLLDEVDSISNYGSSDVDLFAPSNIKGVDMNGNVVSYGGTSGATALVTGVAALIKSINPSLSSSQIKTIILNSVDEKDDLYGKCVTGGRLNAYRAALFAIPLYSITNFGTNMLSLKPLEIGIPQWFKFPDNSSYYNIETLGSLSTTGTLYEFPAYPAIATNTSGGTGNNFLIEQYLSTDNGTYIKVEANSNSYEDYYYFKISSHSHHYNVSYEQVNAMRHRVYCGCGLSKLEPHIVYPALGDPGPYHCSGCGALVYVLLMNHDYSYIRDDGIIVLSRKDYEYYQTNGELPLYLKGDTYA